MEKNDSITIIYKKGKNYSYCYFSIYLVFGSDCNTAKLQPLGSVAILTARWTKVSF